VKVYVASGRFVSVEDGMAVYAIPDRGLLTRAEAGMGEVEAAIEAHFGRSVPLKLVLDDGSRVGATRPDEPREVAGASASPEYDPSEYDFDVMEEAPPAAVVSPEQRLLEAFPGAEEVSY
jgi:hypothetical protein